MSKIEVDAITQQSGTTLTVGGGACKTATVDATTVTLGRSGGTVSLASGATQSGFGRTGTVDWQTTPKTATFTAVSGEGYFANTTGSAFNMNLPAGVAGAIVSVADYAETFDSNNLTIVPNGSDKIGSQNENAILSTEGQSVTFVYVDGTQGWINTMDSTSNVRGAPPFITATGGTITESGNCKIHTFTGPGTFTVTNAALCSANNLVSYMLIAGGGGGGSGTPGSGWGGAGGGAGGFRETKSPVTPYTASPLDGYPSAPNRVTVTAQGYPIQVGGGGTSGPVSSTAAGAGNASVFSSITSTGGGGGASGRWTPTVPFPNSATSPQPGGSGGGAATCHTTQQTGGTGNTPSVTPPQGNTGGTSGCGSSNFGGGGGGGSGGAGNNSPSAGAPAGGGQGGAGVSTEITSSAVTRASGGAGAGNGAAVTAVPGGGGASPGPGVAGTNGTANTGGGAGAGGGNTPAAAVGGVGGSGIVVIRYKFQ
jgi:hypothetical protein